jgi:hypothetical protein
MKPLRFSEAEVSVIEDAVDSLARGFELPKKHPIHSIRAKIAKAREASTNVAVAPIEQALVGASRCKVVPLVTGHGQASVRAGKLGVTPEQAELVGRYIASQGWLRGPLTLLDVLNKWPQYLSKAQATKPPPSVPAGLNGGTSGAAPQGPVRAGQGSEAGRPAPGFGGGRKDPHPDGHPGSR